MFYPTCYVYKIVAMDESTTTNEPISSNKKSDLSSSAKKSKTLPATTTIAAASAPTTTTTTTNNNTLLDILTNSNKNDNILVKNLSNQLLISAQRTNCIDIEKKFVQIQRERSSIISMHVFLSLDQKINVY